MTCILVRVLRTRPTKAQHEAQPRPNLTRKLRLVPDTPLQEHAALAQHRPNLVQQCST